MKVYFAGKIGPYDWRHKFFPDISSTRWDRRPDGLLRIDWDDAAGWFGAIRYGGPFFIPNENTLTGGHGTDMSFHGHNTHGVRAKSYEKLFAEPRIEGWEVVKLCKQWIAACDVFFAWMDQRDAFGTFAEIGYAAALGKPIWLFSAPSSLDYEAWFLRALAQECRSAPNPEIAVLNFIEALDPDVIDRLDRYCRVTRKSSRLNRDAWLVALPSLIWELKQGDVDAQLERYSSSDRCAFCGQQYIARCDATVVHSSSYASLRCLANVCIQHRTQTAAGNLCPDHAPKTPAVVGTLRRITDGSTTHSDEWR